MNDITQNNRLLELKYFKDVDGHEVDFVILKDRKPWIAIEVKSSEQPLGNGLKYFLERFKVPYAYQIQHKSELSYQHPKINGCQIRIMPVAKFLSLLP